MTFLTTKDVIERVIESDFKINKIPVSVDWFVSELSKIWLVMKAGQDLDRLDFSGVKLYC